MKLHISFLFLLILLISPPQFQTNDYKIRTIAFYNVENLFDTINHPNTFDDDFTPNGKNRYNSKVYHQKINNIGQTIYTIGRSKSKMSPVLIGLAEIENDSVLQDLMTLSKLKNYPYRSIHFNSPDQRGIDVALLYQKKYFKPIHQEKFEVKLWNDLGQRIYTRDILLVSGVLDDELIHLIIGHWPSRRGGQQKSAPKRQKAAYVTQQIVNRLQEEYSNPKIILMGDFNDNPTNQSLLTLTQQNDSLFYNPMLTMYKNGLNSLGYRDRLYLFDQILVSPNLCGTSYSNFKYYQAGIFNPDVLIQSTGKYKGYPLRSFENNKYVNGYSDHFPVYIYLLKK